MRLLPQLPLRPLPPAAPSFTCDDRPCEIPSSVDPDADTCADAGVYSCVGNSPPAALSDIQDE